MLAGQWRIEIFELVVFNILKKRVGGAQLEPHSLPNQSLTFLMRFYLHTITHSTGLAQHCLISLLGVQQQIGHHNLAHHPHTVWYNYRNKQETI